MIHLFVKWGAFFAAKSSTYAASCAVEEAVSMTSEMENPDLINPNDGAGFGKMTTSDMFKTWGFAFSVTLFMCVTVYELLGIARKIKSGNTLKQQLRMEVREPK